MIRISFYFLSLNSINMLCIDKTFVDFLTLGNIYGYNFISKTWFFSKRKYTEEHLYEFTYYYNLMYSLIENKIGTS